ncbi:hypothetical protein SG0102_09760 [Intestinibaculum porci]|uniref:Uncharacterized protein n=1 Tax=Intestinibaculum porci TaxID=2487118 RepID=A0A3G9J609_9FIRM|nr:hypothetical protein SG0102_09760 [Intestinibaculum porci]
MFWYHKYSFFLILFIFIIGREKEIIKEKKEVKKTRYRVTFISQRRKYLLHIDLINDTMYYANECKNNVNGGDEDGK